VQETTPFLQLWQIVSEFTMKHEDWLYGPFASLDADSIETLVVSWSKVMTKLARNLQREELQTIAADLKAKLDDFQSIIPIISCVCSSGMRPRHWQAVSERAGFNINPAEDSVQVCAECMH
jgi:Dynein heavy chain, N-terminal region 2